SGWNRTGHARKAPTREGDAAAWTLRIAIRSRGRDYLDETPGESRLRAREPHPRPPVLYSAPSRGERRIPPKYWPKRELVKYFTKCACSVSGPKPNVQSTF